MTTFSRPTQGLSGCVGLRAEATVPLTSELRRAGSKLHAVRGLPRLELSCLGAVSAPWSRAIIREMNECVFALNFMDGKFSDYTVSIDDLSYSSMPTCLWRIYDAVASLVPPADLEKGEAALSRLLAGRATGLYLHADSGLSSGTLASYQRKRVAIPCSVRLAPNVGDICSDSARKYLEEPQRMLQTKEMYDSIILNQGLANMYMDPVLSRSRRHYVGFLRDLVKADLLDFTIIPTALCGIFFVCKKDGSLRLILDARRANQFFRRPPSTHLVTGEGLSRVELVLSDDESWWHVSGYESADGSFLPCDTDSGWRVAAGDIQNAFHNMLMPRWLRLYFGMPAVTASELGISGLVVDGVRLAPKQLVHPLPKALPMGFSWSMFF